MGKGNKVRVALSLDAEEVKIFKDDARDMGLSLSQYVELLLIAGSRRFGEEARQANDALEFFRERAWESELAEDAQLRKAAGDYMAKR